MGTVARGAKSGGGQNFNAGQVIDPAEVNTDFNTLYAEVNGLLDDTNLETGTLPGAKSLRFTEISDPSAPASNDLFLYAKDDGSGTTRLYHKDSASVVKLVTPAELVGFNVSTVGTIANTSSTALLLYTLPAGLLATAGDLVRLRAWGYFAANANGKTIALQFGATLVATVGGNFNNEQWFMEADVSRLTATTQSGSGLTVLDSVQAVTLAAPGETLANAISVSVVGLNSVASANDIVTNFFRVEFLPYQPRG